MIPLLWSSATGTHYPEILAAWNKYLPTQPQCRFTLPGASEREREREEGREGGRERERHVWFTLNNILQLLILIYIISHALAAGEKNAIYTMMLIDGQMVVFLRIFWHLTFGTNLAVIYQFLKLLSTTGAFVTL
jgi:hypothetical protein